MIDSKVQRLLEEVIDLPIKLQLLLLFSENPRMEATAAQIADRIYRDIWSTREALREMAEDGILTSVSLIGEPIYRYRPHIEHIEPIFRLCRSYNEPLERDQIQNMVREVGSYAPYRRAARGALSFERL